MLFRLSSKNKSSKTDEEANPIDTPNIIRDQTPSQMTSKTPTNEDVVTRVEEVQKEEVSKFLSLFFILQFEFEYNKINFCTSNHQENLNKNNLCRSHSR